MQAQMQGDLFYLQLVGNMTGSADSATGDVSSKDSQLPEGENQLAVYAAPNGDLGKAPAGDRAIDLAAHPWSLEFRDIPDVVSQRPVADKRVVADKRPVTSRLMASVAITDGDPLGVMDALGYK